MAREPYAETTDVRRLLTFLPASAAPSGPLTPIPASYRPNASQVYENLIQASNDLDATLALVDYAVPVPTGATMSREILRGWTAVGAAALTVSSMPQGQRDSKHQDYAQNFSAILKGIRERDVALPDAGKEARARVRARSGVAAGAAATPYFTRDSGGDR